MPIRDAALARLVACSSRAWPPVLAKLLRVSTTRVRAPTRKTRNREGTTVTTHDDSVRATFQP